MDLAEKITAVYRDGNTEQTGHREWHEITNLQCEKNYKVEENAGKKNLETGADVLLSDT